MIPLDKQLHADALQGSEDNGLFRPIQGNGVCTLLGDKWTVQVLWRLSLAKEHRLRFSALKKEVDGVTQRMLTLTLRNLERNGLVVRHYFPEVPPRVEYELTEMGGGALRALEGFNFWVRDNLHTIQEYRRAYDDAT
ncbi:transcriptional regulator [Ensifer sp. NM-2]|uniref:winged helix-turn-helix transcriptional regulator n=1 Tax=Ensifer sp. NM-2 TaxID=2109730 RepID=UPI000D119964|nr:helix-turn-helix domain-containing protein [Ensifer sp. NM-2]PSS59929.1 transcriptional regulator [Ensifer sp. NM-2]